MQSKEKHIVLTGASLERMEHHPAQGWGGQAQPQMDLGQGGSCSPVQHRYRDTRGTSLSTTPECFPTAAGIGWAPPVPLAPRRGCRDVLWEMGYWHPD